jgi:FixJ family two-component response regulator
MNTLAVDLRSSTTATEPNLPAVFVVDDDLSVRESLESLIRLEGFHVETFLSATAFLSRSRISGPSCLVLDLAMPGLNGLELQQRVAIERPDMPIIFISGYGNVPKSVQAMKAGAVEFLTKPYDDDVLLDAIRKAIERSAGLIIQQLSLTTLKSRYDGLTRREIQVFELVLNGCSNKEVGKTLGISEITVKAHRGHVMRKMEADSLADLIRMAKRLDMI